MQAARSNADGRPIPLLTLPGRLAPPCPRPPLSNQIRLYFGWLHHCRGATLDELTLASAFANDTAVALGRVMEFMDFLSEVGPGRWGLGWGRCKQGAATFQGLG
jgi:hypothetical protein